jgi:hypothetical protein
LLAPVFVASNLGSSSGFANFEDEVELGRRTGNNHHSIDASRLEQRSSALVVTAPVDSELDPDLAGLVSGREVMGISPEKRNERESFRRLLRVCRVQEGKEWQMNSPYP